MIETIGSADAFGADTPYGYSSVLHTEEVNAMGFYVRRSEFLRVSLLFAFAKLGRALPSLLSQFLPLRLLLQSEASSLEPA
jgi:hypothetical protein